jgi:hypothetical protein
MPRSIPPAYYAGGAKRARTDGGAPTPEQALVEWALAGGAELAGIVIAAGPESNSARGFVAAQDTPAQACVLKLPHALVLSTSVALEAAVGQCITQHPGLRVLTESSVEEERLKWEQESEAQPGSTSGRQCGPRPAGCNSALGPLCLPDTPEVGRSWRLRLHCVRTRPASSVQHSVHLAEGRA